MFAFWHSACPYYRANVAERGNALAVELGSISLTNLALGLENIQSSTTRVSSGVFNSIFAARSEEIRNREYFAEGPTSEVTRPDNKDWETPVNAFEQEIESYGAGAENITIPAEREPEVEAALKSMGLDNDQVNHVVASAKNSDGTINAGKLVTGVRRIRQQEQEDQGPAIPAGNKSKVLSLLEKMGVDSAALEKVSDALGDGAISLRKLAAVLSEVDQGSLKLDGETLGQLKSLLVSAGVPSAKANKLIERHTLGSSIIAKGQLNNLLVDAAGGEDKAIKAVKSGEMKTLVHKMMDGAMVENKDQGDGQAANNDLAHLLSKLKNAPQTPEAVPAKSEKATKVKPKATEAKNEAAQLTGKEAKGKSDGLIEKMAKELSRTEPPKTAEQAEAKTNKGEPVIDFNRVADRSVREDRAQTTKAASPGQRAEPPQTAKVDAKPAVQVNPGQQTKMTTAQTAKATGQAAPTPRSDPAPMLNQLGGRMVVMLKGGSPSARIQLQPAELGSLKIDLHIEGKSVRAVLVAENAQVQQMLGGGASDLKQQLADQGYNLDSFEVVVRDDQNQSGNQQAFREAMEQNGEEVSADGSDLVEGVEEAVISARSRNAYGSRSLVDLVA